jgi:pimeloyl-ACP methyl ester carboxylesterase
MNLAASRLLQTEAPWTFGLFLVLAGCEQRRVDVGGYRLWTAVAGRGSPTVVFEAGGGDDASVWLHIEPEVRRRLGVRTFRYNRAGLGKSDPSPGPYRIDDEAVALERALDRRGVRGPIVLVAHSYGGFVATLVAASDTRVAGVVLDDANLSGFFDAAQASRLVARYTPQFDALERARPALAHVMVPLMRALPETARRMREMTFPPALPTIDIVAERPWVEAPDEVAAMQRAHASFVAASPAREAVFASGSGHYVMRDRPDLVIDAIARMVQRVRGR